MVRRLLRGPAADPAWARPGLLILLSATAAAYLWALDASGYGNEYYAAAAYSGSQSWTAWLFGSFDSASFISVDKPPFSLWMTGLSIRLFGLSHWSVLVPQAMAGVGAVAILHHTVKRWKGHAAALLAGVGFAATPVVVVMFRYNNPDAMLTLLLVAAVAATYSAIERGSGWRLGGTGALVGLAFLAKTTQALLVIPGMAIAYLVMAPVPFRRRVLHGIAAAATAFAAAGWWVVLAVTSDAAPYAGQTTTGSFIDYILGINGLGRLGAGEGPGNDPFGGSGGWGRLFNTEVGGQVSWLMPLVVIAVIGLVWRRPATRMERAGWLLWGTVFATHFAVFSLMSGVFHPYYSMTIAPSIAVLAGAGVTDSWRAWKTGAPGWWLLPAGLVGTGAWSAVLLGRTPGYFGWLGAGIVAAAVAAGAVMAWSRFTPGRRVGWAMLAAVLSAFVCLAGPGAYALTSIGRDYSGGDPKAGPAELGVPGGPMGIPDRPIDGPQGVPGEYPTDRPPGVPGEYPLPPQYPMGTNGYPPPQGPRSGPTPTGEPGQQRPGVGGGPEQVSVDAEVIEYLVASHEGETWLVATVGTRVAARIILETGEAVMAMGGFSGGDPTPTSEELAGYIERGEVRFVLFDQGRQMERWSDVVVELCSPVGELATDGRVLYDCAATA
ncbi:MAG: glycosyltransferase family 39 protein [Acidimicrobiia bacterium]|nr:glycosyltransferase family 39 protein [Acidimicrobiia bacterium]